MNTEEQMKEHLKLGVLKLMVENVPLLLPMHAVMTASEQIVNFVVSNHRLVSDVIRYRQLDKELGVIAFDVCSECGHIEIVVHGKPAFLFCPKCCFGQLTRYQVIKG